MIIKYDESFVYIPGVSDCIDPILSLEANKAGSLTFTLLPSHELYGSLGKLKVKLKVYDDDNNLVWKGRVLSSALNLYNENEVVCEGKLACLNDSLYRPGEYSGTVTGFFEALLSNHNSQVGNDQKIFKGTVSDDLDDNNYIHRSWDSHTSTWELIYTRLLNEVGGYLRIRYEANGDYLDYLSETDLTTVSNQRVELSENLIDINKLIDASETYTVCIPVGAEDETTGTRTDVTSIDDATRNPPKVRGQDFILASQAMLDAYGYVYAPIDKTTWDDVTLPLNLYRKACSFLDNQGVMLRGEVNISFADLSKLGEDVDDIRLYDRVHIFSPFHNIDSEYLVKEVRYSLSEPETSNISIGDSKLTLTDKTVSIRGAPGADGEDATTLRIDSSRGTVFKNNQLSTILGVCIYKGSRRIETEAEMKDVYGNSSYIQWYQKLIGSDTWSIISRQDPRLSDGGFHLGLTNDDVDTKVVFMAQLIT